MIAEISNTTLAQDRGLKRRIYARAGVACYWIVNLVERQVEVYTDPTGPDANPTYRQRRDYRSGEDVPVILDGVEVARIVVADLLP